MVGAMEFHQLRYFVAAAEELSMSRAAGRLHVSQPAMSRQIGLLEEELGVLLFERVRQRIHLSDAGRFFLGKARQILCDTVTSAQQVREQFGGERKTLRLGFIGPFLDDLVAPTVREFRQRHETTSVSLFDLPPNAQVVRLRQRQLDAAIVGNIDDADRGDFAVHRLSRHRFALVVPIGHPLAGKSKIKLAALKGESWVSLSEALYPGRREFLHSVCLRAGFTPRVIAELDSIPLMLVEIANGDAVGILPAHSAKIPHAGCVFVPIAAPVPVSDLLLLLPKSGNTREMQGLAELLKERAAELSDIG